LEFRAGKLVHPEGSFHSLHLSIRIPTIIVCDYLLTLRSCCGVDSYGNGSPFVGLLFDLVISIFQTTSNLGNICGGLPSLLSENVT